MTDQWGRFEARAGLSIVDLGGQDALEIKNGTATHTSGEGWDYSYPSSPDATINAETMAPSVFSGVEDSGTFEGVDQLAFIEDDTHTIVPYGVEQEPPTRVTELSNGIDYEVQSAVEQGDGLERLELVEI